MIKTGLVSLTFNDLSILDIVRLAADCCMQGIEWSADRHLPVGELELAARINEITHIHGLHVSCYGSHYRAGIGEGHGYPFDAVLRTAQALGAPSIRVWAGNQTQEKASFALCKDVNEDLKRIATLSEREGIAISLEMQANTLAETADGTLRIIEEVSHSNISIIWKLFPASLPEVNGASLTKLMKYIGDFRVFYNRRGERRPLQEGESLWRDWLYQLKNTDRDRYAMLELIPDDSPQQLKIDAQNLRDLVYVTNKF